MGMRIMKYRSQMIQGQFLVRNRTDGEGVEAICTVPNQTSTSPD